MNNLLNTNEFLLNKEAYFLDEENIHEINEIFSDVINNKHSLNFNDFIYHSNTIDEELPTLITPEIDINLKPMLSNEINCCLLENAPVYKLKPYDSTGEIIDIIAVIKRGQQAATYVSIQKHNNQQYVVLTKTSNKYNPRNFALPISIIKFVADCILEADKNKDAIVTKSPTSRKDWLLCKEYGSIYSHPQNCIVVSHQYNKGNNYLVLTKYDHSHKPHYFSFLITYGKETGNALLKAAKKSEATIAKEFASINIRTKPIVCLSPEMQKLRVRRCSCGHIPVIQEVLISFLGMHDVKYTNCYCPNCRIHSKSTLKGEDDAFYHWNQMINTQLQRKSTRFTRRKSQ